MSLIHHYRADPANPDKPHAVTIDLTPKGWDPTCDRIGVLIDALVQAVPWMVELTIGIHGVRALAHLEETEETVEAQTERMRQEAIAVLEKAMALRAMLLPVSSGR